jgi:choline kinase
VGQVIWDRRIKMKEKEKQKKKQTYLKDLSSNEDNFEKVSVGIFDLLTAILNPRCSEYRT